MKHDGPFRPGDFCDGYQIVGSLGKGGFGTVYEAVRPLNVSLKDGAGGVGRRVALKCLQLDPAVSEDQVERLKKAARLLMHLRHPNIVSVLDAGTAPGGVVYFVMERLYGASLREVARRERPMPVSRALHIVSEVGDGLAHASEFRIVHRDLKPENIFVTRTGGVKILDFGNARYQAVGVQTSHALRLLGMPQYLSPEQLAGLPDVDQRTDIFALGVIAHELLSERYPFARPELTQAEVRDRQLSAAPEALDRVNPAVPPYLAEVIATAMASDRDRRYQTSRAFVRALRDAARRYEAKGASFLFRSNGTAPPVVVSTAVASSFEHQLPVLETENASSQLASGGASESETLRAIADGVPIEFVSESAPPLPTAPTVLISDAKSTRTAERGLSGARSRSRWLVLSLGFAIGLGAVFGTWIHFSQASSGGSSARRDGQGVHVESATAATRAASLEHAGTFERAAPRRAESVATMDSAAPARPKRESIAVDQLPVDGSPEAKKPRTKPVALDPEPDFFRTMGDD